MGSKPETRNIPHGAFDFFWRLAVLLLPWQIRWFQESPVVNGFPSEMGNLAIYASWIPLAATIFCPVPKNDSSALLFVGKRNRTWFFGIALVFAASFFTRFPRATLQWWVELVLLGLFVRALIRHRVPIRAFAAWFAFSLLPHAALGLFQYSAQFVHGSKWLGMAAQDPLRFGVSVIEHDGRRWLRVYGGFPHPNVFGGWLAVALPIVVWLAHGANRKKAFGWIALGTFFSSVLVLTYSRGAWLASSVALFASVAIYLRRPIPRCGRNLARFAFIAVALAAAFVGWREADHIFSRFQTKTRSEARSVEERKNSFKQGLRLFVRHPLFGTGPNASVYEPGAFSRPAHHVPVLMLAELGTVGTIGLLMAFIAFLKRFFSTANGIIRIPDAGLSPAAALVSVFFFDHYPWTLWSGHALVALLAAFAVLSGMDVLRHSARSPEA